MTRSFQLGLLLLTTTLPAQQQPEAKAIITTAVQAELEANRTDHTPFLYRDRDITPDADITNVVIETPAGNYKRKVEDHGKPLTPAQTDAERSRVETMVKDSAAIAKQRANTAHDDDQAEQMLKLLPTAYLWSTASEQGSLVTLNFKPDPAFSPATMEARVLSAMAGQVVVDRSQQRIRTIKGTLVGDVTFGYGLFGRLHKGGSFEVQRREVAPRHWQMTESHVHINGKALFFKSIGSTEDETRWDFKISPAQNVRQAYELDLKR